ncbi:hypothetical protein ACP70R_009328 [Stipagrostis hirtigluma subsp. patula]
MVAMHEWMLHYNHVYKDAAEKAQRFEVLRANMKFIESFNSLDKEFWLALMIFRQVWTGGARVPSLPSRMKARVLLQRWRVTTGKLFSLSTQEIAHCDGEDKRCYGGGDTDDAIKFIIKNGGLAIASNNSRTSGDEKCKRFKSVATIKGYEDVPTNDEAALMKAVENTTPKTPFSTACAELAPKWYLTFTESVLSQFDGLEDANDVLVNSFRGLEPMDADYLKSTWRAKTIGPTLQLFYLDDGRQPSNKTYGFILFSMSAAAPCMAWLDNQAPCSVVLVSHGTVADLDTKEIEELGNGLWDSGKPFLWVLRRSEAEKISEELVDKWKDRGLIVPFCPLLEMLAHQATEAIVTGVPMVAMPQWADQPTIAKYVESVWGIGMQMRQGLVRREEVKRCIREVMDGKRNGEYRRNAAKGMRKAKVAIQKGGTSYKNIAEFASSIYKTRSVMMFLQPLV